MTNKLTRQILKGTLHNIALLFLSQQPRKPREPRKPPRRKHLSPPAELPKKRAQNEGTPSRPGIQLQEDQEMLLTSQVTLKSVQLNVIKPAQSLLNQQMQALITHASEWTLSNQEFHRIVNWSKLLPPSVDLMAISVNRKVDTFISPYPHPEALAVDALSTNWELPGTLWLYPPTALMTKVISKIRETNSITLILIAPDQPTRAWYPDLLSLTHRRTREVGRRKDTIIQHVPHLEEPITLEEPETLKLKAWIIQK